MINIDFSQALAIDTRTLAWQPSPVQGVWRKPLAREDAERGLWFVGVTAFTVGSAYARARDIVATARQAMHAINDHPDVVLLEQVRALLGVAPADDHGFESPSGRPFDSALDLLDLVGPDEHG